MRQPLTTYRQALDYIDTFINLERGRDPFSKRSYRLDRMRRLLDLFGHPEKSLACVHLAGSKGKGSTAVMLASVLEAAGHKTGLYTSPHLLDIRERLRINRRPVSRKLFTALCNRVKNKIDPLPAAGFPGAIRPTFFEIMTVIGLLAFKEKRCRYAVLETGLGGRLDATNVVTPIASLLTFIELEHEDVLGHTVEKIAREKCGIIKPGVPVFAARQTAAVRKVIRRRAAAKGSPLAFADEAASLSGVAVARTGTKAVITLPPDSPVRFSLALTGDYQAENAALVWLAVRRLFPALAVSVLRRGLERAVLPGRFETVAAHPPIVIDGAHTPGSTRRVLALVRALLPAPRILVFAAVLGKKYRVMARILAPHFKWIVVSTPGAFRQSRPRDVFRAFQAIHPRVFLEEDPAGALAKARRLSGGTHPVFATGSLYFIAEIKKILKHRSV